MPIERRSAKEPALAAATGVVTGTAEKKKIEQEIDWQRESEIRANNLKMQMQEEEIYREFLNEQRRKQLEDEKWHRARKWELDKAEIASRNDFAKEEEERQKANAEFENQIKEIDKQAAERGWTEKHPHVWNQKVQAALKVEKYNLREPNRILGIERALEQERRQIAKETKDEELAAIEKEAKRQQLLARYIPESPDKWYTWGPQEAEIVGLSGAKRPATPAEIKFFENLRTGVLTGSTAEVEKELAGQPNLVPVINEFGTLGDVPAEELDRWLAEHPNRRRL